MKLVRLGPDEVFHLHLTPKWALIPLSGAGAATKAAASTGQALRRCICRAPTEGTGRV